MSGRLVRGDDGRWIYLTQEELVEASDRRWAALVATSDAGWERAAPNAIVRHVYFFEPCTDHQVLIGRYTSGGAYVSAITPIARADWLTTTQRAAIRAIEARLSAGDDPREISPQIRVVLHGA